VGRSRSAGANGKGGVGPFAEAERGLRPNTDFANEMTGDRGEVAGEDRKEVRDVI
jgi:hypothetical protein